ncbi:unnamed protein product [Parnassius mnemosyne]|uniref:Endonuclease/exonuclease/phosphatase domain-containing protein n=1 Tax=Parnassius mnemosyne TaxID=213953 RepID=A0AAV1KA36_9NEOP
MPTTKRKIVRKKVGKTLRDIDDIICLLRDANSDDIPVFVARDLEKLPPVLFDHIDVTRLLKDIVKLQLDINMIKEEYATVENINILKGEVEMLKNASLVNNYRRNVNQRRGAYLIDSFKCHSGPMVLPPMGYDGIIQVNEQIDPSLREPIYRDMGDKINLTEADIVAVQETWLLPHDLAYLRSIDNDFAFTDDDLMASIIESHNVELVFMLGDHNAHPGESFATELLNFCFEQSWSSVDMALLVSDSHTFVSDAHGCRRWLYAGAL